MTNFIDKLTGNNKINESRDDVPTYKLPEIEDEVSVGNMNQLGYIRAGRHNGDPSALSNSFQLIKSGKIVDESHNEQKKTEKINTIDKEINTLRDKINSHKTEIEKTDVVALPRIEADIENNRREIEKIQSDVRENKLKSNRFNTVILWILFVLGLIYLYLFYVSAIHSALFRNIAAEVSKADTNSVGVLLNNVFNISAYKEFNLHWIAPVVFLIFAAILHLALEIKIRAKRAAYVAGVVLFVLLADSLLAYFIERNNHILSQLMGLTDDNWAFYKSSGFYLVLFFGFFTSMGWSIILHKLAGEYASGNPERKASDEIHAIEKRIRQLIYDKSKLNEERIVNANAIDSLEHQIKNLEDSRNNVFYSIVDLENNIDDFYNGWLSYLNGLKTDSQRKQNCERVYLSFKSEFLKKSLTA